MGSHHHHEHHHINNKNKKLFILAATLTLFFALLEIIYGFISGSLMIIGDGVHMSSDAISLTLSLIAVIMASKVATKSKTFGYKRFEPLAAFVNGLTLIVIPLYIIYEAITRIFNPIEIMEREMLIVGMIGLAVNVVVGYILSKGESNINMRSAMLHVIADMITSLSAVIVALAIMFFDLVCLDPVGSIITSIIIIRGGISITKESFNILMEGTPKGYCVDEIKVLLEEVTEVTTVSDIKIWCINEEEVYTLINLKSSAENNIISKEIKEKISNNIKIPIEHIYINIEH